MFVARLTVFLIICQSSGPETDERLNQGSTVVCLPIDSLIYLCNFILILIFKLNSNRQFY